ncbi:MAG TPA: sterol desaturase family protein, partial [Hyphomicrobiaceae bacterium]|nr:sterol desaturase family protein [Hyphomicrobiaceae bacterium]
NYFVSNGFFYWLCWKSKREAWAVHRIQKDREPRPEQVASEIRSSVKSLAWYAAIATFVLYCFRHGHTALFIGRVARGYHLASLIALMFLHDTYFYWLHRFLHVRPVYRLIHQHHHDSRAPTPWAAYSLSNGEAILQCPLWVLCFTVPVHPAIMLTVLFLQNIYDTFGHLGFEFFPKWMLRSRWLCAVQATPTHHDAHHRYFRGNYGHYFNIWDRLMGTELPQYASMCQAAHQPAASHGCVTPSSGRAARAAVKNSENGADAHVRETSPALSV